MKHPNTIGLVALSLLLSLSGAAQVSSDVMPLQANEHKSRGGNHQSRMLHHLLTMDDAQLNELKTTIERIQGMTPEEKAAMRERVKMLNRMPREEVEAMRKRFEAIPQETREEMRQRWREMSPEERRQLRETIRNLPSEKRHQFMMESGIMPPHPPSKEQRGPNGKKDKGSQGEHGREKPHSANIENQLILE